MNQKSKDHHTDFFNWGEFPKFQEFPQKVPEIS